MSALPADIEMALVEYRNPKLTRKELLALHAKLTALLSGYVEDALRWREMGATRYPPPPRTFGGSND